jgi:dihydropteroate synthase
VISETGRLWRAGSREILLDHPIVMGILTITPDRTNGGGKSFSAATALDHVARMVEDGVDIVDVGGESTRPGSAPAPADAEIRDVIPMLREVREHWPDLPLAIDTVKTSVARAALDAGADIINDVSSMRLDPVMPKLAGTSGCGVVLTHSRGGVADMATYAHASYNDVTKDVIAELSSQMLVADEAGVSRHSIVVDPGFGFSKTTEQSMRLLRDLERLAVLDVPVMVGASRKRFVREMAKVSSPGSDDEDAGTATVNVTALEKGARIFRVHNVALARSTLDAAWANLKQA